MADVGAVLHAVEVDLGDGRVRARCACRTESPSAVTHSTRPPVTTTLPSSVRGAGVEHLAVGMRVGVTRSRP